MQRQRAIYKPVHQGGMGSDPELGLENAGKGLTLEELRKNRPGV